MNIRVRIIAVALLIVAAAGCNRRTSLFETTTGPSPVTTTPPLPPSTLYALRLTPAATSAGGTVRGTVVLTFPAPAGGTTVSLSSGSPLVTVPSSVTVPAGADLADFSMTASTVVADTNVTISGTAGGRTVTTTMSLWAMLPTFFSFVSEAGDYIGAGGVRRLVPPFSSLTAACSGSDVNVTLTGSSTLEFWRITLGAVRGQPLTVGTYENAQRAPFRSAANPGIDIGGEGRGCNTISGRFVVHEADFTANGQIRRFSVSFEQHCEGLAPALVGDLRISDGPAPSSLNSCLR